MKENSNFRQAQLENGLKLLGEVNPLSKSAAIGYFVKTGARDETSKESGVSHFLEHMMFKGTKKRNSLDITFEMGNMGAQANAYTSEETTVFYSAILPEYFSRFQELLSDMLRPSLDQAEFDMEKKVILEEIALYQDKPHFYLYEHALKDFFGVHPAGQSVLGSTASVGALTREEMKDYFDRRYSAGNMTLVGTGNFSWEQFVKDAERLTKGWSPSKPPRERPEHRAELIEKVYRRPNLSQAHVLLMAPGAAATAEERYALVLLSAILGDSSGSRMYWDLVHPGIAESAGAEHDERDGTGVFLASATCEPANVDKVSEILRGILSSPLDFNESDLERAKTKMAARIVLGGELAMGRLMAIGSEWTYRQDVRSLKEIIARIRAVDRQEIQRALSRYPLTLWSEFRLLPE